MGPTASAFICGLPWMVFSGTFILVVAIDNLAGLSCRDFSPLALDDVFPAALSLMNRLGPIAKATLSNDAACAGPPSGAFRRPVSAGRSGLGVVVASNSPMVDWILGELETFGLGERDEDVDPILEVAR